MGTLVSNESRGRTRVLIRELEEHAGRITAAARALPAREIRDAGAFRKTSERALDALTERMRPLQPFHRAKRQTGWRFLKPVRALPGVAPPQPGLVVTAVMIGAFGRSGLTIEPFGVQFTAHALHRLFDRGPASVDAVGEMLAAHTALLRVGPREGDAIFRLADVVLPSITGAFLTNPAMLEGGMRPMATCRTWIAAGQTYPDQAADLAAWWELLETDEVQMTQ